ncbi:MAG: NADPH:quinone oxidoreductase family protein, partial [Pseudomonadota bacterium]
MRAMMLKALNERLEMTDAPRPEPGPGEALIRVKACGINFADTLMAKGKYQEKPELPFAPGLEVGGVVEALGDGADPALKVGMRVAALVGDGGLAEYATAKVAAPIPEGMSFAEAAGFLVTYGTSHIALDYRCRMQPGENLVVLGAAGGVGLTAVEIGKLMGATVIASARGSERLETARAMGADHLIDSGEDGLRERLKALGGVDVLYDAVGGPQFHEAMRACNPEGRLLPIGFASGDVPQIPANILLVKNLIVHGFYWGAYARIRPHVLTDSLKQLLRWYEEGRLKPHVSNILPLEQANDALDLLRTRAATGK